VRLVLKDGSVIEGGIFLGGGHALALFLSSRKSGWVNLVDARWLSHGEVHPHAVVQTDHILMARSMDGTLPVQASTATAVLRDVVFGLEDGMEIMGRLHTPERQRLCDYLHSCGKFLPVRNAVGRSNEPLGDVALNSSCVRLVSDVKVAPVSSEPRLPKTVAVLPKPNRDVLVRDTGQLEVITEGREPDRRLGQPPRRPSGQRSGQPLPEYASGTLAPRPLTGEERLIDERLATHWLVKICAKANYSGPDSRIKRSYSGLADIWNAIAERNAVSDREISALVAASYGLQVAELGSLTPKMVGLIPEKPARKLGAVAFRRQGTILHVAVSDPKAMEKEQQISFATGLRVVLAIASPSEISEAHEVYYRHDASFGSL